MKIYAEILSGHNLKRGQWNELNFGVSKFLYWVHICAKFHENWKGSGFFLLIWYGMTQTLCGTVLMTSKRRNQLIHQLVKIKTRKNFSHTTVLNISRQRMIHKKRNMSYFSTLARVAREYLAIPAMSTPSERMFSAPRYIRLQQRSCSSGESLYQLVFLNKNF